MRFLLDQSTDARLVSFLATAGHDAKRVGADFPSGIPDHEVFAIAGQEQRILITDDRDFGELVFRLGHPHTGVIYLRLGEDASLADKWDRLSFAIVNYQDQPDQFLVVTPKRVRVR
jgi:predicted nuclease of predicted toxin-antitoxin system